MLMYESNQIHLLAKKEPVSILWQSIFMIIPVVDLFAAYRVEKLRKYLLFLITYVVIAVILILILFPDDESLEEKSPFFDSTFDDGGFGIGFELIAIGISIILIRKWSKEWNKQFSENSTTMQNN